jgi:hypothetical protein
MPSLLAVTEQVDRLPIVFPHPPPQLGRPRPPDLRGKGGLSSQGFFS